MSKTEQFCKICHLKALNKNEYESGICWYCWKKNQPDYFLKNN